MLCRQERGHLLMDIEGAITCMYIRLIAMTSGSFFHPSAVHLNCLLRLLMGVGVLALCDVAQVRSSRGVQKVLFSFPLFNECLWVIRPRGGV